jgi:hypothetical protein
VTVAIHVPDYPGVENPSADDVWEFYRTTGITEAAIAIDSPSGFVKTRKVMYEMKIA